MELHATFEVSAIKSAFKRLSEVAKTDEVTRKIAGVLREEAERAFENEHAPNGESWTPLNPQYKAQREKRGRTGNMLQVSGSLIKSLNLDYGDNFAVIGASESYGQFHQVGTAHIPARPFLGLGEAGIEEIKGILNNALKRATSG